MLMTSYVRRKRWESKLLASEIVKMLSEAVGGNKTSRAQKAGKYERVSPDSMLGLTGKKL